MTFAQALASVQRGYRSMDRAREFRRANFRARCGLFDMRIRLIQRGVAV